MERLLLQQELLQLQKDEYLSGEGQATVPALNKGQFALIPVSIFLQQELNAAEDVVVDQDEETITPSEVGGEQKGGENTSSKEKEMDPPYTAKSWTRSY